jgi:hypothetical protein
MTNWSADDGDLQWFLDEKSGVRNILTTENTEKTQSAQRRDIRIFLCSLCPLCALCGEKLLFDLPVQPKHAKRNSKI